MTRILHVLDHALPLQSGYTFRTRAILKAQTASGLDVRGITGLRHLAAGPDCEEAEGLTFFRTRGSVSSLPAFREWREIGLLANAIERAAQNWQPDILHAHSPALCGKAALIAGKRLGLPVVYEIRAFWEDAAVSNGTGTAGSIKYRLTRALESHVAEAADAVVTICQGLKQDLVARGIAADKITISPNGVDLSLFGKAAVPDPLLAHSLGLGHGPVIGFIGSFYDYEGLDDLISAMPGLIARTPDAKLMLVGGGPCEKSLRKQAANSTASDAIRFVGRVPHGEVERYYALVDVMAYPRKRSRLTDLVTPLKPLEAMAQGQLVAASDVGGHRELIADGVTGTLFPPDDAAACAVALANLLEAPEIWEARRAAGRTHVAASHDWSRNIHRYHDIYQALLARKSDRPVSAAA